MAAAFNMDSLWLKIAAFVVPLGFDTFAVAVALGLRGERPLLPALAFAFFEAVMPLAGLFLGYFVGARFETAAAVAGGLILIGVALYMFKEAFEGDSETASLSFSSLRAAALAGFAISMDELAIGFPMAASGLPAAPTIGAIAVQTLMVTYGGVALGNHIGARFGREAARWARFVAAAAFGALGVYLIAQRAIPGLPRV